MKTLVALTLLAVTTRVAAQNSTFCASPYEPDLCPNDDHIACIDYWNTFPLGQCPAGYQIVDLTQYIQLIVQTHNKLKNQLAGGGTNGLPTASRMPTVVSRCFPSKFFSITYN